MSTAAEYGWQRMISGERYQRVTYRQMTDSHHAITTASFRPIFLPRAWWGSSGGAPWPRSPSACPSLRCPPWRWWDSMTRWKSWRRWSPGWRGRGQAEGARRSAAVWWEAPGWTAGRRLPACRIRRRWLLLSPHPWSLPRRSYPLPPVPLPLCFRRSRRRSPQSLRWEEWDDAAAPAPHRPPEALNESSMIINQSTGWKLPWRVRSQRSLCGCRCKIPRYSQADRKKQNI